MMYYRRLPKTDVARIRALSTLSEMEQKVGYQNLPFSLSNFNKLKVLHTLFISKKDNLRQAIERWQHINVIFQQIILKLKLYISHFIQVYNFAVIRGEFKQEGRAYFQLPIDNFNLPSLSSEEKIVSWSKILINGERQRVLEGGTPMTNPTIANLNVYYEKFKDIQFEQNIKQMAIKREQEVIINERVVIDELIKNIWNEIEQYFDHLSNEEKMVECQKYGITYYRRSNEVEKANTGDNLEIPFN